MTTPATTPASTPVIVCGHLEVDPAERDAYLEGCREVVASARADPACLEFSLSADLLEPGRIQVLERWASQAAVERFRGDGVEDDQRRTILGASVTEHDVSATRVLA